MSDHLKELESRIDSGETFDALRKAGKITLGIPAAGEGSKPLDNKYPYVAKGLTGLRGTETLQHTPITKGGVTMQAPVIESAKQEREFMAKYGYRRD